MDADIFQAQPDAVVAVDAAGVVRHLNRAAAALGVVAGEPLAVASERSAPCGELMIHALADDRLRRELLPTLAHELRTPLNAIIGFTELIHKGKVGAILPAQEEYMGDVLTSARSLLRLLNDLLDLAKREPIADAPIGDVVLSDVINEVAQIARGQAAAHGHRVSTKVDPAIGTVVADPVRLKRIIYELVASAARIATVGEIQIVATLVDDQRYRIDVDDVFSAILPVRTHART